MQYNGSQTVLDIRDDLGATMNECREVTEKYRTGRSAYLRIGQLFMKLFAGLLQQKEEKVREAKIEKAQKTIKESNEYYNQNAKPGSLAAKANMVQKYNEKHSKQEGKLWR